MGNEDNIIIRQAGLDDIDRVMEFLRENWGENHVMANSRALMCYEHTWLGKFTYVIAEDSSSKKIYGVCGYLPYSVQTPCDMGAGIWKTIPSPRFLLGTEILKYVQDKTGCRMLACCGTNLKTKRFRKLIGHFNGKLNQFYRLNEKSEYKVAIIANKIILHPTCELKYCMEKLETIEDFKEKFQIERFQNIMPYRDIEFINHRYYNHIKYRYILLGIHTSKQIDAVVVGREVHMNGRKIFRIIDFLGDANALRGTFLAGEQFIGENDYEYIDFYEYGLPEKVLNEAGFVKREDEDVNIIPNYFEPFEERNVEIHISTNVTGAFRMFKGDGDQDRPNDCE